MTDIPDRRVQVDEHAEEVEKRFEKFFKKALIAIAFVGITSTIALGGFGYVLVQQNNDRKEACQARNTRHDNAVNALIVGSNLDQQNATTEASKVEIRRRRDVTLAIIDGVAPKVDCDDPKQPAVKVKEIN